MEANTVAPEVAVLGERIETLRSEVGEMRSALQDIATALGKIVLIEERHQGLVAQVADLSQKVSILDTAHVVEQARRETAVTFGKVMWAVATSGGVLFAYKMLDMYFSK